MEYPVNQSAWRRGWNDTKIVWASWQFFVLDAVVAVIIGGVFLWYLGLALVFFSMFSVWLGATALAPVKQRNEARNRITALEVEAKKRSEILGFIGGIENDIITGREILARVKNASFSDAQSIVDNLNKWRSLVGECLQRENRDVFASWFNATYTSPPMLLGELAKACERGLGY